MQWFDYVYVMLTVYVAYNIYEYIKLRKKFAPLKRRMHKVKEEYRTYVYDRSVTSASVPSRAVEEKQKNR